MTDILYFLQTAEYAAREAGKKIMEIYHTGDFQLHLKNHASPITIADKSSNEIIMHHLKQTKLPILSEEGTNINFIVRKNWEYFWMIDPLGGTKEFIQKNDQFTVNIALVKENISIAGIIYVPSSDTLYYGSKETGVFKNKREKLIQFLPLEKRNHLKDILQKKQPGIIVSRSHISPETDNFLNRFHHPVITAMGSSLKFMWILENRADIYPRFGTTMEWDTAAAHAILNATNRGVYELDLKAELVYNKRDLKNPSFIVF